MPKTELIRTAPEPLSRWDLTKLAMRSYWTGPLTLKSPEIARLLGDGYRSGTGIAVSPETAMNFSPFFAAVKLISSDIAALPLELYKRGENGAREKQNRAQLYRLLHDRPNPEMNALTLRQVVQAHALTWHGGFMEIERDGAGRPVALWPLTPDRVTPFRRGYDAPLEFRVSNPSGTETFFAAGDIIHIPGLGWDGANGYNLVQHARETIGLGIATERFGASFFGNGSTFGGVISYPTDPSPAVKKDNREVLATRHQGVERAHGLLALYGGAKYEQIGIAPELAQFLETRQFQVTEVARWFNLPPHKIADLSRSTNNNIEQQTRDYFQTTLLPWIELWEQELAAKLIPRLEQFQFYIEHNTTALLKADAVSRGDLYQKRFNTGSITPNGICALENEAPIAGGDVAFVPLANIPLPLATRYFTAQIEKTEAETKKLMEPTPAPVAPAPPDPNEPQVPKRELDRLDEELALARRGKQEAEDKRDLALAELATVQAQRVTDERAHAEAIAEKEAQVATSREAAREAGEQAGQLAAERDRVVVERDAALVQAAESGTAAASARETTLTTQAALRTAEQDHVSLREDVSRLTQQVDAVTGERDRAVAAATDAGVTIVGLAAERDALVVELARVSGDLSARTGELSTAVAALADIEPRMRVALAERATADAVIVELRARIEAVETLERAAREQALASEALRAAADVKALAADEKRNAVEADAAEKVAEILATQDKVVAATVAVRAVFVDAMSRIVQKEADRARKQVASPEKFAKWMDNFYSLHDDACRATLRPAVRAWLALQGDFDGVDAAVDALVSRHIEQSLKQLRAATQDADADTLAGALEKVLHRWEHDRADATADLLLRKVA